MSEDKLVAQKDGTGGTRIMGGSDTVLSRTFAVPATLVIADTIRGTKAPFSLEPTTATWSTRTPDGVGSVVLKRLTETRIQADAWGDGASWMLDQAPLVLGSEDNLSGFNPDGPIGKLWRQKPFRLGRTDRPWDSLVSSILGQKVQVSNAKRSGRLLASTFGDPAPGPIDDWVLPAPETVAELGYHNFHPLGVERKRAETLIRVANEMRRLTDLTQRTPAQVQERLRRIRGIGGWTAAMVTATSMGDADAVPLGDFHLPNTVAWTIAGEERADDERMLELLGPFAGHRWRVIRLAKGTGGAPKRGPRLGLQDDGMHRGL